MTILRRFLSGFSRWLLATLFIIGSLVVMVSSSSPLLAKSDEKPSKKDPLEASGEIRVRWEGRDNKDFNDLLGDTEDLTGLRARLNLKYSGKPLTFFLQMQDTSQWKAVERSAFNRPAPTETGSHAFMNQGYVEWKEKPFSLKLGRQLLIFGEERLIGSFQWNNIGRTYDVARFTYEGKKSSLDLFGGKVAPNPLTRITKESKAFVGGIHGTWAPTKTLAIQGYLFLKNDPFKDVDLQTYGFRLAEQKLSESFPLDYMLEAAFQRGTVKSGATLLPLRAHAAIGRVGYTFPGALSPRIGLSYAFASGDEDPGDGEIQTFDNLYPTNHPLYGYIDYMAWKNMKNLEISLSLKPHKEVWASLDYHLFSLGEPRDAWYLASGASFMRDVTGKAGTDVGKELDLTVKLFPREKLQLQAGYSLFFPGEFVRNVKGRNDTSHWMFVMATLPL